MRDSAGEPSRNNRCGAEHALLRPFTIPRHLLQISVAFTVR